MRKIKWKFSSDSLPAYTKIGGVTIHIYSEETITTKKRSWCAYVWSGATKIAGPQRYTLHNNPGITRAKKDAIRLVRKYLLDHYHCLITEMKKFDLLEEDHTAKSL
jgi:hypothetical protein